MHRPGERHTQATKSAQSQMDVLLIGLMAMSKPCVSRLVTVCALESAGPPVQGRAHVHEQAQTGAGDGMSTWDINVPRKHGAHKRVPSTAHVCKHPQTYVHTFTTTYGTYRCPWIHQPTQTRSVNRQEWTWTQTRHTQANEHKHANSSRRHTVVDTTHSPTYTEADACTPRRGHDHTPTHTHTRHTHCRLASRLAKLS